MFVLFKSAGYPRFQLFKVAGYSKPEILGGLDTKKGQGVLRGLLWDVNRAPAAESSVEAALAKLKNFINSCIPAGIDGGREGESAWWLRDLALATPHEQWDELLGSSTAIRDDLEIYWSNWNRLKEIGKPGATQLSSLKRSGPRSGLEWIKALDEVVRAVSSDKAKKIDAHRSGLKLGDIAKQEVGTIGDWRIEIPLNTDAARWLGAKTSWCTANRHADQLFNWYSSPADGKYIYVVTNTRTGDRYQALFHNPQDIQIRDENDEQVSRGMAAAIWFAIKNSGSLPDNAKENESTHLLDAGALGYIVGNPTCDEDDLPHSSGDEPTVVSQDDDGYTAVWYNRGALHKENGPAASTAIHSGRNAGLSQAVYYQNGVPHREGNLPHVEHRIGGVLENAIYLEPDGKAGRDPLTGPATIIYDGSGAQVGYSYVRNGIPVPNPAPGEPSRLSEAETFWVNESGRLHREGGPAIIENQNDPDSRRERWHKDGYYDRPISEGPAVTGMNGNLNQYWVNNDRVYPDGSVYQDPASPLIDDMSAVGQGSPGSEVWQDKYAGIIQDIYKAAIAKTIDHRGLEDKIRSVKKSIQESPETSRRPRAEISAAIYIFDKFTNVAIYELEKE